MQEVILNCRSVSLSEKTRMDDRELDLQLGYILFIEVNWLSLKSSMYILILNQKCTSTLGLEIFLYKQNIDIIMVYPTIFYVLAWGVRLTTNAQGRFLCRQRPVFPVQYKPPNSFYSKDDSHSLGEDSAHWIWSMSDPSRFHTSLNRWRWTTNLLIIVIWCLFSCRL